MDHRRHGPTGRPHPLTGRVVVVEDDPAVAWWTTYMLTREHYEVNLVTERFDRLLRPEVWEDVDVAIIDLVLPGDTQGLDVVTWLGEHRPDIRRIVLTASPWKAPHVDCIVLGKPTPPDQLLAAVRGTRGGRAGGR